MHGLLDEFLVGIALLASIIYALFSLGPRTLRRGLAVRAAALLRLLPATPGLRSLSRRLETAAVKPAGACGGCDDCGSATPAASPGSTESEIRIPVSSIGKR
jgi:hypothetical protein